MRLRPLAAAGRVLLPETKAYLAKVAPVTPAVRDALNTFFQLFRTYNCRNKVIMAHFCGAGGLADFSVDMFGKQPNLTHFGDNGPPGAIPYYGVIYNPTLHQYSDTGYVLSTSSVFKTNDAGMFLWCSASNGGTTFDMGAYSAANPAIPNDTDKRTALRIFNNGKYGLYVNSKKIIQLKANGPIGFVGWNKNPVNDTNCTGVRGPNINSALAWQGDGVPVDTGKYGRAQNTYSDCTIGFGLWTGGLPAAILAPLSAAVQAIFVAAGTYDPSGNYDVAPSEVVDSSTNGLDQSYLNLFNPPGLILERPTPPPTSDTQDKTTYDSFPVNRAMLSLGNLLKRPSTASFLCQVGLRFWMDGANFRRNGKPNPTALDFKVGQYGLEPRLSVSTIEYAQAFAIAKYLYHMGGKARGPEPKHPQGLGYLDVLDAVGLTTSDDMTTGACRSYASLSGNQAAIDALYSGRYAQYGIALDVIVMHPWRLCDLLNPKFPLCAEFDTEPNDGRTFDQLNYIMATCFYIAHHTDNGKGPGQHGSFADPINDQNVSGLSATPGQLRSYADNHDWIGLLLSPGYGTMGTQYTSQIGRFAADGNPNNLPASVKKKLWPYAGLGSPTQRATLQEMRDVHAVVVANGVAGVIEWPNRGAPGGPVSRDYNQDLGALCGWVQ